jgi:hydrogenase-4 membrane subunit HyfE
MSLPSSSEKLPPIRGIGVLALICSSVFIYLGIYEPISDAASHKPTVSLSRKAAFIAPMVLALGIVYTVFGERAVKYLGWGVNATVLGWAFIVFFILLGIIVYFAVENVVQSYGYSVPKKP